MTVPVRPLTGMQPGTQPGQSGQQQQPVHPTVGDLGLPGAPVTIEQPRSVQVPQPQSQQQWQMPAAPQQPNQTFPNQPQQPQYQQPAQQQPQTQYPVQQGQFNQQNPPPGNQPVQRVSLPDNVILDGEGVPPELRGRTWGQIKQIHSALAIDFVSRQQGVRPQQQPQAPQQQPVQRQPLGRPQQQAGNGDDFWADPVGTLTRVIDERVQSAIAPVTQRTTAMAVQEARQIAQQGIADFQMLEADIIQNLQGLDAGALSDPRTWQSAANMARGKMVAEGRYQPPAPGVPGQPQSYQPAPQRGPGAFVPAVGTFFSEQPTPPNQQSNLNLITPDEEYYAQKMGMTNEEYVAWRGGVVQNGNARRMR